MHPAGRLALLAAVLAGAARAPAADPHPPVFTDLLPDESLMTPAPLRVPVVFVTRNQPEWAGLAKFWNEATETATDPDTGAPFTRKVVKIKVPLGLTTAPVVPPENPLTVEKWALGKRLYFDKILSTDGTVACASCHSPDRGWSDGSKTSTGIGGAVGGANAPTVMNSAYFFKQFWDGRAASLEEQAQGPVGNTKEMFAGKGDHWQEAVERLRAKPDYVLAFYKVFGHAPTRDAAAKAIAAYERTVLVGNGLQDRAEAVMRKRVIEEETGKFELKAEDYTAALKDAFAKKDATALKALGLDPEKDADKADATAKRLLAGRTLFFGKARCTNCHTGDNYSDSAFHNLGVGAENGELPADHNGRYAAQPLGHKDLSAVGAFKTPGLRGLLSSGPYMHTGAEKTLEAVVDLYDRGGNVNPYLSEKMRDTAAEAAYLKARAAGQPVDPAVKTYGPNKRPIIPFKLNLTPAEKADLVLFLKGLQGDPVDATVADPTWFPTAGK